MFTEVLLFVLFVCLYKFWQSNHKPAGYPPGPIGIPILGYLPFLGADLSVELSKLSKKFGNVFSIQLGSSKCVVLSDVDIIRQTFKIDECNGRPDQYFFTGRSEGKNGIIANDASSFTEQRRFTVQHLKDLGFGKKALEGVIHEETEELLKGFRAQDGQKVDLKLRFNMATVNILWHIVAGERYEYDDEKLIDIVDKIDKFTGSNLTFLAITTLPLLQRFPKFSGFGSFLELLQSWRALFRGIIEKHKSTYDESDMRDFTDVYLRRVKATADTKSSFYKDAGELNLRCILEDLFGAGSETTSTTLSWTILYLILNPEVQEKLHKEIDAVIGRDRLPRLEDRASMPYMQATLNELWRISSVLHLSLYHLVTKDTEIAGFNIPKDTVLISNLGHVHYDPKIWGDPTNFRPERFLNDDGQVVNHDALIPFGVGKRVCLGEPLARNELFLLLTGILQSIKFLVPEDEPRPTTKPNPGLVRQPKPYKVIIKVRDD